MNDCKGESMTKKSDLKKLANEIREINGLNGWNVWQREHFLTEPYKFGAVCALIHSEISEALEWNRQMGKTGWILNDKIMKSSEISKMIGVNLGGLSVESIESDEDIIEKIKEEMADILIRVLDWWSAYDDDPIDMINMKLAKNRKRGYRHGDKRL